MLLTVWMYAYLRGVLSSRAVEDRCRYDATFRVACGRQVPGHTTLSRFRKYLLAQDGLAEELFYRVLRVCVCACAGPGRLSVVAGDGVKIAASASKEASRTEAGLRKLAGQVMAGARKAADAEDAQRDVPAGTDLLLGAGTAPGPDPRSRAGRVLACLEELAGEREAAQAAAREQGQAYLQALAAGTPAAGPRPRSPLPPRSCGWRRPSPRSRPCSRPGRRAATPGSGSPARRPGPAPARRPARPAPAWRNCGRGPPRKRGGKPPGTGRSPRRRGVT